MEIALQSVMTIRTMLLTIVHWALYTMIWIYPHVNTTHNNISYHISHFPLAFNTYSYLHYSQLMHLSPHLSWCLALGSDVYQAALPQKCDIKASLFSLHFSLSSVQKYGRRLTILWNNLLFLLGALFCCLGDENMLYVGRFIAGMYI